MLNKNTEMMESEYLRKALEYAGYDGIDMDAYYEGKKRWGMPEIEPGTRHYIAFDENQPKSATLNNGEFSIINDNIYQARINVALFSLEMLANAINQQLSLYLIVQIILHSLHETGHFLFTSYARCC